jgi:hypothetical protein
LKQRKKLKKIKFFSKTILKRKNRQELSSYWPNPTLLKTMYEMHLDASCSTLEEEIISICAG